MVDVKHSETLLTDEQIPSSRVVLETRLRLPGNGIAKTCVAAALITAATLGQPLQFSAQEFELLQADPSRVGAVEKLEALDCSRSEFRDGNRAVEVGVG